MGVILGLTLSACGGAETEDTSGSTTNLEAEVSAYAAPEVDTGFEDSTIPPDQTTDDGGSSSTMTDSGSSGSGGSDSTSASSTADGGTGTGSGTGSTGDSGTGGSGSSG